LLASAGGGHHRKSRGHLLEAIRNHEYD
jgi:hypothetical protein